MDLHQSCNSHFTLQTALSARFQFELSMKTNLLQELCWLCLRVPKCEVILKITAVHLCCYFDIATKFMNYQYAQISVLINID